MNSINAVDTRNILKNRWIPRTFCNRLTSIQTGNHWCPETAEKKIIPVFTNWCSLALQLQTTTWFRS